MYANGTAALYPDDGRELLASQLARPVMAPALGGSVARHPFPKQQVSPRSHRACYPARLQAARAFRSVQPLPLWV